jgi:hypothetical protein
MEVKLSYDWEDHDDLVMWTCPACKTIWFRTPRWFGGQRNPHVRIDINPQKQVECTTMAVLVDDPVLLSAYKLGGAESVAVLLPSHEHNHTFAALIFQQHRPQ